MHRIELPRTGSFIDSCARDGVVGLVSIGAPVPLVSAGVGIENDDATVAVAIRDEDFVGLRIDTNAGGSFQILGVVATTGFPVMADLQNEFPALRELEDVGVFVGVSAYPNVFFIVDEDAMLIVRPLISLARATPSLNEVGA